MKTYSKDKNRDAPHRKHCFKLLKIDNIFMLRVSLPSQIDDFDVFL
jgi:hypothetical protein